MAKKQIRVASISDLHCPFVDLLAFRRALPIIKDFKPDVFVLNGDLLDEPGFSRFFNEGDHDWIDELRDACHFLRRLRDILPTKAKRYFLEGNHDNRVRRKSAVVSAYSRRALHWTNIRGCEEFEEWKFFPYRKRARNLLKVGPFLFWHGFSCAVNSDELEAFEMAELADLRGCCCVRGHTHQITPLTQARRTKRIPVNLWYANTGCFCRPDDLEWADIRSVNGWRPGIFLGTYDPTSWEAEIVEA